MSHQEPILVELPERIDAERVYLRPYRAGDGEAVFAAVEESIEGLRQWLPWTDQHGAAEASEAFARRARARWELREDLTMAICRQEDGRYLGGSGLHRIKWDVPSFEIGYWIRSSEEGKGYVSEAVLALTRFAFESLAAERVFIRCAHENQRSRAVASRLGFLYEGTARNEIRLPNGDLTDMATYALTSSDWCQRGSGS